MKDFIESFLLGNIFLIMFCKYNSKKKCNKKVSVVFYIILFEELFGKVTCISF